MLAGAMTEAETEDILLLKRVALVVLPIYFSCQKDSIFYVICAMS
jgi:hypothetical protein